MHRGGIDILGEVVVAMTGGLGTDASPALLVEVVERRALDVTHVGDGDHHGIVGIEVLGIELVVEGNNLRATLVAILLLHLLQLLLHHLLTTLGVVQDFLQVGNQLHQVVVLLVELIDTQTCELSVLLFLIMCTTSSILFTAMIKPSRMWARSWAFFRSYLVRRIVTS